MKLGLCFLIFSSFFMMQSCTNSCGSYDCVHGECEDGNCVCENGYEGGNCNTAWTRKFVGTFNGQDCYDSGQASYTFASTSRPDSLIFDNRFYGFVQNGTELEFPSQEAEQDGIEYTFSGTGTINGDKVELQLYSDYEDFNIKCELTLTRSN